MCQHGNMITAVPYVFAICFILAVMKFFELHPQLHDVRYLTWLPDLIDWMPWWLLGVVPSGTLFMAIAYCRKQ